LANPRCNERTLVFDISAAQAIGGVLSGR